MQFAKFCKAIYQSNPLRQVGDSILIITLCARFCFKLYMHYLYSYSATMEAETTTLVIKTQHELLFLAVVFSIVISFGCKSVY